MKKYLAEMVPRLPIMSLIADSNCFFEPDLYITDSSP